jgi:hypothetical protein
MNMRDIQIVDTKVITLKDINISSYKKNREKITEFTWFFKNDKTGKEFTRKTLTGKNLPRHKKDNHITLIRSLAEYSYGNSFDFSNISLSDLIGNKVIEIIKVNNYKYFSTFSPVIKEQK